MDKTLFHKLLGLWCVVIATGNRPRQELRKDALPSVVFDISALAGQEQKAGVSILRAPLPLLISFIPLAELFKIEKNQKFLWLPRHYGSFLCSTSEASWVGTFTLCTVLLSL